MNNTSRNRNLIFIIAFLLLTNIGMLVYFLWMKNPRGPQQHGGDRNMFSQILKDSVGFNDQQVAQYEQLKDEQKKANAPHFESMRRAKDSLFRLLSDPNVSDSMVSKAADVIAMRQRALDLQTFEYFSKIRTLCTSPEQQVKYDSAVQKMFRKIGNRPMRRGDMRKERKD